MHLDYASKVLLLIRIEMICGLETAFLAKSATSATDFELLLETSSQEIYIVPSE